MSDEQKVINIGNLELWRTGPKYFRKPGECDHRQLIADEDGEILTCKLCKKQISAYWAFMRFTREYKRYLDSLKARAEQVKIREEKGVTLKAAQKIEKAWRSRTMAPACPHCKKAILPTDGFGGLQYNKKNPEGAEESYKKTAVVFGL